MQILPQNSGIGNNMLKEITIEDLAFGIYSGEPISRPYAWAWANCFVVSFPKSGRKWIETILQNYSEFIDPWPLIMFTHDTLDDFWQDKVPYNHLESIFFPTVFAKRKTALLVRDPRDVLVSYYWQKTVREPWILPQIHNSEKWLKDNHLEPDYYYKGSMAEFARDEVYGIPKIVAFMNLWADFIRKTGGICVISYEGMHLNCFAAAVRLLKHFGIKVKAKHLRKAISEASFDKMKGFEKLTYSKMITDQNQMKARKGKVGSYKQELDRDTLDYVNGYIADNLHEFWGRYE